MWTCMWMCMLTWIHECADINACSTYVHVACLCVCIYVYEFLWHVYTCWMYAYTWVFGSYVCVHAYKSMCIWYICIYEHVVCVHTLCTCVLEFTCMNVLIVCCGCTCDACVCTHVECVYVIHVCPHTTCVIWSLWQYRRNPHTLLRVLLPSLLQTRRAGVSWGSAGLRDVKGSWVRHWYYVRDWTGSLRGTGHPPHWGEPFCSLWQFLCPWGKLHEAVMAARPRSPHRSLKEGG